VFAVHVPTKEVIGTLNRRKRDLKAVSTE